MNETTNERDYVIWLKRTDEEKEYTKRQLELGAIIEWFTNATMWSSVPQPFGAGNFGYTTCYRVKPGTEKPEPQEWPDELVLDIGHEDSGNMCINDDRFPYRYAIIGKLIISIDEEAQYQIHSGVFDGGEKLCSLTGWISKYDGVSLYAEVNRKPVFANRVYCVRVK